MSRILGALFALVLVVGFGISMAFAEGEDSSDAAASASIECYSDGDGEQDNPGKLFQAFIERADALEEPVDVLEYTGHENLGEYIADRCEVGAK